MSRAIRHCQPRRRGLRIAMCAMAALPGFGHAQALPHHPTLRAGTVAIAQEGDRMKISQGSDRAVIDWQSFDIGEQSQVTFVLPSATAAVLNRVTGGVPSTLAGALRSNGIVFLINSNGIDLRAGSAVTAAGFIASMLDIRDRDFLHGDFGATWRAGRSDTESRALLARLGRCAVARRTPRRGEPGIAPRGIFSAGTIGVAEGGMIALVGSAVVQSGDLLANGGRISLLGKTVSQSGTISTGGRQRGEVDIIGHQVALDRGFISVSSEDGGGTVHICTTGVRAGEQRVHVGAGAYIVANGLRRQAPDRGIASGGDVRISSLGTTIVNGAVIARGNGDDSFQTAATTPYSMLGPAQSSDGHDIGGAGGGAVIMGGEQLHLSGDIDVSAAAGAQAGFVSVMAPALRVGTPDDARRPHPGGSIVSARTLEHALASGNVTLFALPDAVSRKGSLLIGAPVQWSADTALTLCSMGTIGIHAAVTGMGDGAALRLSTTEGHPYAMRGGSVSLPGAFSSLQMATPIAPRQLPSQSASPSGSGAGPEAATDVTAPDRRAPWRG